VIKKLTILIFVLIGFAIGGAVGIVFYDKLFTKYLTTMKENVDEDWGKMQYYSSKIVDRLITLKEMMTRDKLKYDTELFDTPVATRSKMLGADTLKEKAVILSQLEGDIDKALEFYNKQMKLRHDRFYYLDWGLTTKEIAKSYIERRDHYRDTVGEYNFRIHTMPFVLISKNKGYADLPMIGDSKLTAVQLTTEEYSNTPSEESPDSLEHGAE
jgi:hypothetical protein